MLFNFQIGDVQGCFSKGDGEHEGVVVSTHQPTDGLADLQQADIFPFLHLHVHGIRNGRDVLLVVQRKCDLGIEVFEDRCGDEARGLVYDD